MSQSQTHLGLSLHLLLLQTDGEGAYLEGFKVTGVLLWAYRLCLQMKIQDGWSTSLSTLQDGQLSRLPHQNLTTTLSCYRHRDVAYTELTP